MWVVYASLAAVFFGTRGILYHRASRNNQDYNLFLCGVYFMGAVVSFSFAMLFHQAWSALVMIGVLIGACSFASNGAMYKGFAVGKASMIALLTGLPAVITATGAYFLWGETLNNWQLLAFVAIIAGILLIRFSGDVLSGNLKGIQWGLIALLFFGLTDLMSKQAMLLHVDIFPLAMVLFTTGSILFYLFWLRNRRQSPAFRLPSDAHHSGGKPAIITFLRGMTVGLTNVGGMICIFIAFETGATGLVSAIASANVLIIVLYAKVFLKEKFNRREWIGAVLTFAGLLFLHFIHWMFEP